MNTYALNGIRKDYAEFNLAIDACCFKAGEVHVVHGPNGSGKSTLLMLLAFLDRPDSGAIVFQGDTVDLDRPAALLPLRRRVGVLMQNPYLFNMSVADNVGYGLRVRDVSRQEIRQRVEQIMEHLSLSLLAHRKAHTLSGGEAQRVALARTLVLEPEVLLLDEPTANVDRSQVDAVERMIKAANRERGTTVILTTHSESQAYRLSDHFVSIIDGRMDDIVYENILSGTLAVESDGLRSVSVSSDVAIRVARGEGGAVTLAIDPRQVILSQCRLESSAQNSLKGVITRVEQFNGSIRVFVDVGVPLCAVLTMQSFTDMRLNVGKTIWATFKANAVKVL